MISLQRNPLLQRYSSSPHVIPLEMNLTRLPKSWGRWARKNWKAGRDGTGNDSLSIRGLQSDRRRPKCKNVHKASSKTVGLTKILINRIRRKKLTRDIEEEEREGTSKAGSEEGGGEGNCAGDGKGDSLGDHYTNDGYTISDRTKDSPAEDNGIRREQLGDERRCA